MKQQFASSPVLQAVAAACLLISGASAQAATNWNVGGCSLTSTSGGYSSCNGVEVRASSTNTSTPGSGIVSATVVSWSGASGGLGVSKGGAESSTGPHALDNYEGLDALIFKFTDAVSLTGLTLGWNGSDYAPSGSGRYDGSDVSIYAWTGASATPTGYASSVAGWALIGDYMSVGLKPGNTQTVTTPVFSSYWLVSAYGAGTSGSSDAFKVLSLAGNYCGALCAPPRGDVPEPGSLALMAMGAFGLMAARRRQKNQAI